MEIDTVGSPVIHSNLTILLLERGCFGVGVVLEVWIQLT